MGRLLHSLIFYNAICEMSALFERRSLIASIHMQLNSVDWLRCFSFFFRSNDYSNTFVALNVDYLEYCDKSDPFSGWIILLLIILQWSKLNYNLVFVIIKLILFVLQTVDLKWIRVKSRNVKIHGKVRIQYPSYLFYGLHRCFGKEWKMVWQQTISQNVCQSTDRTDLAMIWRGKCISTKHPARCGSQSNDDIFICWTENGNVN